MGCPPAWRFGEGQRNHYRRRIMLNLTVSEVDGLLEHGRQSINVARIKKKKNTHRVLMGQPKRT
jgi:hypothetical protein